MMFFFFLLSIVGASSAEREKDHDTQIGDQKKKTTAVSRTVIKARSSPGPPGIGVNCSQRRDGVAPLVVGNLMCD